VNINEVFDQSITGDSIRANLQFLSKDPHTGGTAEDEVVLVNYINDKMTSAGLEVKISEYEVLLSYPQREDGLRNYVAVDAPERDNEGSITGNWTEIIRSAEVEEILSPSQDNPLVFNPFM